VIKVVLTGSEGKMGRAIGDCLVDQPDMELVGAVDPPFAGKKAEFKGRTLGFEVSCDLVSVLKSRNPDVLVDFTRPDAAADNALIAIRHGVRPVVGTTGITALEMKGLEDACKEKGIGAVICPNFSVGILALKRAMREAAVFFKDGEVVEMHHNTKIDAPSGTALNLVGDLQILLGKGITVHSVRLPGLVAHHEVIFGTLGQSLSLRHDTYSREAFMPGILAAIRKVMKSKGLIQSLEEVFSEG